MFLKIISLVGLLLSSYILIRKSKNKKLVCLINEKCNIVLDSKYSTTLGIRNELLGIFYYLFIFVSSFTTYNLIINLSKISAIVSILFSIYLAYIQIFKIKQACMYCYSSYLINILILILIL